MYPQQIEGIWGHDSAVECLDMFGSGRSISFYNLLYIYIYIYISIICLGIPKNDAEIATCRISLSRDLLFFLGG